MSQTREIHKDELEELAWVDVRSSQIRRVVWLDGGDSYDLGLVSEGATDADDPKPNAPHLLVDFHGSGVYAYDGADHATFVDLVSAESVGRELNASVKGKYGFTKLTVIEG